MSVETALRMRLQNQPGELARVAGQLGKAGVNIRAVAAVAGGGGDAPVELLVDNPSDAVRALREAGASADEVRVALAWLPDRPGVLGRAADALAGAGINIESVYVVRSEGGRAQVAFGCVEAERADQLLAGVAQG